MSVTIEQASECMKNISKISREIAFYKSEKDDIVYFNLPKTHGVIEYEKLLNLRLEELYTMKEHILDAISKIESIDYRVLLEMKYLRNWTIAKISLEMYYSERNIWYMLKKALVEVAKYLDEKIITGAEKTIEMQDKRYYIKCGACGEKHKMSEMKRSRKLPNVWLCSQCYKEVIYNG